MLSLVGVFGGVSIDASHTDTVRGPGDTSLGSMDIVVDTVQETSSNHSRKALGSDLDVGPFVDLSRAHWVVTECAHSPAHWSSSLAKFGVEFGISFFNKLFVGLEDVVAGLGNDTVVSRVLLIKRRGDVGISAQRLGRMFLLLLLHNVVVGDVGFIALLNDRAFEKERSFEDIVPLDCAVLLKDDSVDVWDEEEGSQDSAASSSSDGDTSNLDHVSR